MARGKSINAFLIDGEVNGRIKCEIANWVGLVYKIPRVMLSECKDIPELKQSGVYFLFGNDENNQSTIYIGQAIVRKNDEGLLSRIKEPHSTIEEWSQAILVTAVNDSLGLTEISYLENSFYHMAINTKRCIVKNGNEPNKGNPTNEKKYAMDEFIENIMLIVGTLGYHFFLPLVPKTQGELDSYLYFSNTKSSAKALRTAEGIVVLRGSKISPDVVQSCPKHVVEARRQYADVIGDDFVLKDDLLFPSPSMAVDFVSGMSLSGNKSWKTSYGMTLEELQNQ